MFANSNGSHSAHDPSANARDRLNALKELLNLDAHPGAASVVQVFLGPRPVSEDDEILTETVDAPADTETIAAPAQNNPVRRSDSARRASRRSDCQVLGGANSRRSLAHFHQKATRVALPPNCDTVDASRHGE
jgi:hypothetical protein